MHLPLLICPLIGGSHGKIICLQCRRPGFDSWIRKTPWRREWQPTSVFLPGESHGQRSLAGYSPWGRKELDMMTFHFFHFPEYTEGPGQPKLDLPLLWVVHWAQRTSGRFTNRGLDLMQDPEVFCLWVVETGLNLFKDFWCNSPQQSVLLYWDCKDYGDRYQIVYSKISCFHRFASPVRAFSEQGVLGRIIAPQRCSQICTQNPWICYILWQKRQGSRWN